MGQDLQPWVVGVPEKAMTPVQTTSCGKEAATRILLSILSIVLFAAAAYSAAITSSTRHTYSFFFDFIVCTISQALPLM